MTIRYTREHEWLDYADPAQATVGITAHASSALGDIVYVELPEVGARLEKGAVAGAIESVKAASDLYSPAAGEVVEVNEALRADPALANADPEGEGWFFRIRLEDAGDADSLLDRAAYEKLIAAL
ncbi:MAG: glycine cleavage system protein GcvH [Steroidobacteraceae bacterium]